MDKDTVPDYEKLLDWIVLASAAIMHDILDSKYENNSIYTVEYVMLNPVCLNIYW